MKRLLGLAALLLSCSSDSSDSAPAVQSVTFEKGFLWGSATAAFQVEKGIGGTDWSKWVETPGKIKNGDKPDVGGADALAHIDEDVALLVATGQNAYRFSIEWTRIYPTKDAFDADQPDAAGIAAYDHLFDALAKANIVPMVTLQHFTMPSWLADPSKPNDKQGWERDESIAQFGTWCGLAAKRWAPRVDWWATINEPIVVPLGGYVQGSFPPGVLLGVDRALLAAKNEVRAHAKCYDAVKAADPSSMVGIVHHLRAVEPVDPTDKDDVAAADRVRYFNNTWILNAVVRGDFDDDFDQKYDGPNDRRADPSLIDRSDYLGINYYTSLQAGASGLVLPVVNAAIKADHLENARPKTDFYWDIYPAGFRTILDEVKPYGKPVVITENGIADSKDTNRSRFLLEHLWELGRAKADGLDVRGYFYWSLLDNFEWASGFCPRFGLNAVDRTTAARTARGSAQTYKQIATTGTITRAQIDAAPAYGPPAYCD